MKEIVYHHNPPDAPVILNLLPLKEQIRPKINIEKNRTYKINKNLLLFRLQYSRLSVVGTVMQFYSQQVRKIGRLEITRVRTTKIKFIVFFSNNLKILYIHK